MSAAKTYVVGFLMDRSRRHVVLVRKNRPAWQRGRLNGVGGKVEFAETFAEAMAREFAEETGHVTTPRDWDHMCSISWPDDLDRVGDGKAPVVASTDRSAAMTSRWKNSCRHRRMSRLKFGRSPL